VLEGCLRPGDRLFLDVLANPKASAVITPGDGTPRLRLAQLAPRHAAKVSLLGFAVLMVLVALWRVLSARPFVAALEKRLPRPLVPLAARDALFALAALPFVLFGWLWLASDVLAIDGAVDVHRGSWAGVCFVAVAALIVAARMSDRRALVAAAAALVQGPPVAMGEPERVPQPPPVATGSPNPPPAPTLDKAREGEVFAVDAVVDPAAAVSPSPITAGPRAHWAVAVTRIYRSGMNYSSEPARPLDGPRIVPIRAKGGAALLDLTHVAPDLRAIRRVVRPHALRRERYRDIVGQAWTAGSTYVLEERFLERGEPVHVIGRVLRFEATDGPAGRLPVLGGTATEPLVIHAGTRRTLLRGIVVERAFLSAAIPLCLSVTLSIAAVSAWLGSR
jgi:hypothetical protein